MKASSTLAVALALASGLIAAGAAAQVPSMSFPLSPEDRPTIDSWVRQNLDVAGYVETGWSPNALFYSSISKINLDNYPLTRTEVWTEVLNSQAAREVGWRSSVTETEIDCARGRRYREFKRHNYVQGARHGQASLGYTDLSWQTPVPETTMATTTAEVCRRAAAAMELYANRLAK